MLKFKKLLILLLLSSSVSTFAKSPKWFKGSVEEAFILAKKESKPMFLYWGALWCPPCNQMKKTVFNTKTFQTEMKNFISVYLDGDTSAAQTWGEKLKSHGYPTMLILNSKREEITRLPTGIDADAYVSLMQKARSSMTPVTKLITKKKLSLDQWKMLALYSWGQDPEKSSTALFKRLYTNVPKELIKSKSRFYLLYLSSNAKTDKKFKLAPEDKKKVLKLLKDQNLVYENREFLTEQFWSIASLDKSIEKKWHTAIKDLSKRKLSLNEKVSLFIPQIQSLGKTKSYSKKLKEAIIKEAAFINKTAKDPYARHAAMTTAIWLLKKTGELQLAYNYALAESNTSSSPFYYMSYLALIEKDRKNNQAYLDWKKRAWEMSAGSATRFQWGTSYLQALIEEKKQQALINKTFEKLINENITESDAFKGRNKKRLERILKSIEASSMKEKLQTSFSEILAKKCKSSKSKECDLWVKKLSKKT